MQNDTHNNDLISAKGSLLLHACCGPCSLEPTRLLTEQGFAPVIFYANDNMDTADEYAHRLATLQAWADSEHIEVIDPGYIPSDWERSIHFDGGFATSAFGDSTTSAFGDPTTSTFVDPATSAFGDPATSVAPDIPDATSIAPDIPDATSSSLPHDDAKTAPDGIPADEPARATRCRLCYRERFEKLCAFAKDNGYSSVSTTLSVSPYQYTDIIEEELSRAAQAKGLEAIFQDFRPFYDEATHKSRELGMYRQNYCGCALSKAEAERERAQRKALRDAEKAARKAEIAAWEAEHAAERKAELDAANARKQERAHYDEKQARKRAILKELRLQNADESRQTHEDK